MAKRRVKKRTHVGAKGSKPTPGTAPTKPGLRVPKSMVIRIGASGIGPSISQLVHDVRSIMEPHTASRLKERRGNKLRDYTVMAGPLGVTHLLLFSKSEGGNVQMRLCVAPRGPTLHFRVEKYSLCKDVFGSQKRPRAGGKEEYMAPPLLVMNNFASKEPETTDSEESMKRVPKHLESLTTTVFQSLFPSINPTITPLKSIKRVLLLDRSPQQADTDLANYILDLRHYAIETRTAKSVPKPLRKLDNVQKLGHTGQKRKQSSVMPNLGKLDDISDYLLDPHAADGFTSASESEPETDAEVEILQNMTEKVSERKRIQQARKNGETAQHQRDSRSRHNVEKKGIKLHELGPRLRLRLTKVEEGLCGGKVMWHEYIHKSKAEQAAMDKLHEKRRQEKERRRAEQKANVERNKAQRRANGVPEAGEDVEEDAFLSDADDDVWDDGDSDDAEDEVMPDRDQSEEG